MSQSEAVIEFKDVSKTFVVGTKEADSIMAKVLGSFRTSHKKHVRALRNVSFQINKGDFVGIIGHNGSGKSTLLRLILGSFPPDNGGKLKVNGKVLKLSLGMGFDPNLTARENIYVNGSIIGMTFKEIGKRFSEIVNFAGVEEFIDTQVKFFSSGMLSRLAFAIAIHAEADVLLLDEFFGGVGDINFRKKSDQAFLTFLKDKTIIIVSHNLNQIRDCCDRVLMMSKGELIFNGNVEQGISYYENRRPEIFEFLTPWNTSHRLIGSAIDKSVMRMVKEQKGLYETHVMKVLQKILKPDYNCLDIGANIGILSVAMGELCPNGRIHSFEPVVDNYKMLVKNVDLADNLFTYNFALSNKNGKAIMEYHPGFAGDAFIQHNVEEPSDQDMVETIKLDDWAKTASIDRLDFIKLDVEGTELKVLQGGYQTISHFQPFLIVEIFPEALHRTNSSEQELYEMLSMIYDNIYYIDRNIHKCKKVEKLSMLINLLELNEGIGDFLCTNQAIPSELQTIS